MILVQEETCRALVRCTGGCWTAKGCGKGKELGAGELLQRESQQLQHHDDNRELQIDVHARMRVAGASKQPECRARTWPNQCGQKFDDRGFGRGSTDGRSSSAEVGAKRKKRKKGS